MNTNQFKQDKYFRKYRVISNVENNLKFHAREEIGDRDKMEDATCCLSGFINTGEIDQSLNGVVYASLSFFGVFDGNAGSLVSNHLSYKLISSIFNADTNLFLSLANKTSTLTESNVNKLKKALKKGFLKID